MAAYERRQAEGRARVAELERELALARDEARRHYREWWQAREDRDHAHHLIRRLHRRIARLRGRPRRVG
ncbi:hypothetical protein [Allonocardiopsis opalescens]|nr:hypothetical protein [Allonocardiopsis opalescens]